MIQYATPDELAHHLDPDNPEPNVPDLATVRILRASSLVRDATSGAHYDVTPEGYPSQPLVAQAFRDATCEQASLWVLHNVDPRRGRAGAKLVVTTKAALGVSVSYGQSAGVQDAMEDVAAADSLSSSAWEILRQAGLITTRIGAASSSPLVSYPDSRPYDPTTGRFLS